MGGSLREDASVRDASAANPLRAKTSGGVDSAAYGSGFGWENRLAQAIVSMVIPRLQSTHSLEPEVASKAAVEKMRRQAEAERFIALVLSGNQDAQWHTLTAMRDAGLDTESIFLDIMTPAIRHLGELWEDDRMSFIDVTTKSAYLQQMMRRLGAEDNAATGSSNRRLLLTPAPGEQHTFGLFLLAEMFLRIGWDTVVEASLTLDQICARLSSEPFDAVGMSVGSERGLDNLAHCVAATRQSALSPDLRIFLGGWAFMSRNEPLDGYGADMVETDARLAVAKAQLLCPAGETARDLH